MGSNRKGHGYTEEDRARVARIVAGQTDESIRWLYSALRNHALVRWMESVKALVGLELCTVADLDR